MKKVCLCIQWTGLRNFCIAAALGCAGISVLAQNIIPIGPPLPVHLQPPPHPLPPPIIPIEPIVPIVPVTPIRLTFQLTDNFTNRPSVLPTGTNLTIFGSLSNATSEVGEPSIPGVSSGQTVWGRWFALADGIATLTVEADTFSPLVTVYTGAETLVALNPMGAFNGLITPPSIFAHLSLVASNNYLICYQDGDCGCHWRERSQITFHVAHDTPYNFCVDSAIITDAAMIQQSVPVATNANGSVVRYEFWGPIFTTNVLAGGNVKLSLQFTPAPPNDDFTNRLKLSGSRLSLLATNFGATKEVGEPNHQGNPGGSSVWYSWTAPASGRVTLSTNEVPVYAPPSSSGGDGLDIGSITYTGTTTGNWPPSCGNEIDQNPPPVFYPVFAAYTGTAVAALTPANYLLAALATFPYAIEFDVVKGQTYQIAYDGNQGTTGATPLYLALTTPAVNDNFANRIPLHGVSVEATGYNAGATHQAGEPLLVGGVGKTVWWTWKAPVSGAVSINFSASDYSFPIGVFTGSTLASLQTVAQGAGGLSFTAVQGQTYQIAVSDYNGLTGAFTFNLQAPIVDLPLQHMAKVGNTTMLVYGASKGVVAALLVSTDHVNWKIVQTQVATGNMVSFQVKQTSALADPDYRAILFDRN
jgi:hypothetical protein